MFITFQWITSLKSVLKKTTGHDHNEEHSQIHCTKWRILENYWISLNNTDLLLYRYSVVLWSQRFVMNFSVDAATTSKLWLDISSFSCLFLSQASESALIGRKKDKKSKKSSLAQLPCSWNVELTYSAKDNTLFTSNSFL